MWRSRGSRVGVVVTAVTLFLFLTATPARSDPIKVNGPLTAKWWQWALSMPLSSHPLSDPPTADCSANQSGKTWFLGGVFNASSGTLVRSCTVPPDVSLLIPAINADCSSVEAPPFFGEKPKDRQECVKDIRFRDDDPATSDEPFVILDGVSVPTSEVVSPDFHFSAPNNNPLAVPGPVEGKAASAGWWALIPPLTAGSHELRFGGTFTDFGFTLDITYHITVA